MTSVKKLCQVSKREFLEKKKKKKKKPDTHYSAESIR